jgi:hypothetical protein
MSGWSESGSLILVKWKKYQTYAVVVDATHDDCSKEIQLSFATPTYASFPLLLDKLLHGIPHLVLDNTSITRDSKDT